MQNAVSLKPFYLQFLKYDSRGKLSGNRYFSKFFIVG